MANKTNLKTWLIIPALLVLLGVNAVAGKTIYVDAGAAGENDGSSWADAFNYLQDALMIASTGDEIRVAQGIYKPDLGGGNTPGDRKATFRLINGVTIRGGYAGFTEADPNVLDMNLYQSVLSGDLNGDDVEVEEPRDLLNEPTRRDNSCHVVTGSHTDETTVLDGFTITAGRCISTDCNDSPKGGAGMRIESGSPTIVNCLFIGNASIGGVAGLLNFNGSNPILVGCTFSKNQAIFGTMENVESHPVLASCTFSHNSDQGMSNKNGSSPILANCTFKDNGRDGMTNKDSSNPILTDCTFINNSGLGMKNWDSSPTLTDCTFEDNEHGGMRNIGDSSPSLTNCTFKSNSRSAIDHNGGSLTLTRCVFSGNSGFSGGGISTSDDLILYNCTFSGNSADASGGGIRSSGSGNLTLHNCTFSGNSAGQGGGIYSSGNLILHNCLFSGNSARRGSGILSWGYLTRLQNCTFSGNSADNQNSCIHNVKGITTLNHCIVWGNSSDQIDSNANVSYSNIQGGFTGEGNVDVDPCFVYPGYWADLNNPNLLVEPDDPNAVWIDGDYHLQSQAGRWDRESQTWVQDNVTSPCIDTGDPNSPIGLEPFPNGGRVNMGAYAVTDEASKSYFGEPVCETMLAGDINGDCVVDFADLAIVLSHWMMPGKDFVNKPPTVKLIEPQDGDQIEWPGPTTFRAEANDVDGELLTVTFIMRQRTNGGSHTIGLTDSDGTDGWQDECTWRDNITEGNWTVWVEAMDNEGAVSVSPEIVVTLYRSQ